MDKNTDTKAELAKIKDLIAVEDKKMADARKAIKEAKATVAKLLAERKALKDEKRAAAKAAFEAYKKGVAERKAEREAKKAERAKAAAEKKAKTKKVVRKPLTKEEAAAGIARGEAVIAKAKKNAAKKAFVDCTVSGGADRKILDDIFQLPDISRPVV